MRKEIAEEENAIKKVEKFAITHLKLIELNKNLAEIIQVELRQSSKFMKEYKNEQFIQYLNLIGDIIREGQEEGIFKKGVIPDIAKRAFFGALDEMSRFWVLSRYKKYDIETAAKQISAYFLHGMVSDTTPYKQLSHIKKSILKEAKVNIVICLKQVPDTETQIKVTPDGTSIVQDDIKWVMNPYDEYGVEEALKLKEKFGGEVTLVGLGPKRVTESIRTALAMGADKGVLINDPALEGSDTLGTAKALAAVIKDLDYDLIFTGQRGVDDDNGLVGAALAELLDIPQLSLIVKVDVSEDGKTVQVNRPVEGQTLVIESSLPALITTQKGLNEPRYASLPGIMKAKKKPLEEKTLNDLGLDPAQFGPAARKLTIVELTPPPQREAGKIIDGETPEQKAAELARLLRAEAKVI